MNNIQVLLNKPDNAEKIRDQIAAILILEIENQKKLAIEKDIEDKNDFDISVYIENNRPWNMTANSEGESPFPLINVCLSKIEEDAIPGNRSGKVKYNLQFTIDCCSCGNARNTGPDDEYIPNDYLSTIRAYKIARIVRNILMSGYYTYLGIRDIVQQKRFAKIETITPQPGPESSIAVTVCRITFEVATFEDSLQVETTELQQISFRSDDNGKINLINIDNLIDTGEE